MEKLGSESPGPSDRGYTLPEQALPQQEEKGWVSRHLLAGIYVFELPCPSSRQVMTMKDSEVASCCSLRKWQAKSLSACDSGCLRLGTGDQPSSDRSSHAQGQLERVNSWARTIRLFGLRCGPGVNRERTASAGHAKTPRQRGGLGSGMAVLQRKTSHDLSRGHPPVGASSGYWSTQHWINSLVPFASSQCSYVRAWC